MSATLEEDRQRIINSLKKELELAKESDNLARIESLEIAIPQAELELQQLITGNNNSTANLWLNYYHSIPKVSRFGNIGNNEINQRIENKIFLAQQIHLLNQSQYDELRRRFPIDTSEDVIWFNANLGAGHYFPGRQPLYRSSGGFNDDYGNLFALEVFRNIFRNKQPPAPIQPEIIRVVPTTEVELKEFVPDDLQELTTALVTAINFQGSEFFNNQKNALSQVKESLQRGDLSLAEAITQWTTIMNSSLTISKEDIEEAAVDVVEQIIDYHILTPQRIIPDLEGNIVRKIRLYTTIGLLEVQVLELQERGYDLVPTDSLSKASFINLFDDPIALIEDGKNVINEKPITILNDGSTSEFNLGEFDKEKPNTSILDVSSLSDDQNSMIDSDNEDDVGETQEEQLTPEEQLQKIKNAVEEQKKQFLPSILEASADTGEDNESVEKEKGFRIFDLEFTATQIVILIVAILLALVGFGGAFIA